MSMNPAHYLHRLPLEPGPAVLTQAKLPLTPLGNQPEQGLHRGPFRLAFSKELRKLSAQILLNFSGMDA